MGVYNRRTSKGDNIVSHEEMLKMIDLKKPPRKEDNLIIRKTEKLESEFVNFDVDNSYPILPFKGSNIVNLDFVYKQSPDGCKACKTTSFLT